MGYKMYRTVLFFSILFYKLDVQALEVFVDDYYFDIDVGLFFTRSNVVEDVVYYIPPIQETFTDLNQTTDIDGESFSIYAANVMFADDVDLEVVRSLKPEWIDFGFLRSDVEAVEHCRISLSPSEDFVFYQSISPEWERNGLVSSSEAFFCRMQVALRPGDENVLNEMRANAEASRLVNTGIAPFELAFNNQFSGTVSLSAAFDFLVSADPESLADLEYLPAITSIGASLAYLGSDEIDAIFSRAESDALFINELLSYFYSNNENEYSLRNEITNNTIVFENTISIDVTRSTH